MRGGYELGLGALTCVYDEASVLDELFALGLGTGFGAVDVDDCRRGPFHDAAALASSSEALSQASSSPQSEIE